MSELTSLGHLLFTQSKKGYRHNIDSVLLANYVQIKNHEKVLDVGSGDGIISILLKDKYPFVKITGIEIQKKLYNFSIQNSTQNNMNINFINGDFFKYNFKKEEYDIILTNPPYFPIESGRCCNILEKNLAKHEITFNLDFFLKVSKKYLKSLGDIYFIYPTNRFLFAFNTIYKNKLFIKRLRFVHNTIDENATLVLLHVSKQQYKSFIIERPLVIYLDKKEKTYSHEVKKYLFMG